MKVVMVMAEPPLPFGNAAARWYYVLLRGLVARGHQVVAIGSCSKPADKAAAERLFPSPEFDLRLFSHPERKGWISKWRTFWRPFSYTFSDDMQRTLNGELDRGYDILHLEQLWCGWLGLKHVARALLNVHHLQTIDLSEAPLQTWRAAITRRLIERTEWKLLESYRYIRSCSPRIVDLMRQASPRADICVVPVGMDHTLYGYIPSAERTTEPTVTLIGSMGWYPSSSAANRLLTRLWPEIRRRIPNARLRIVGWSARSVLRSHLNSPGVEIFEDVADVQPFFREANVFLYAPARGSGMKIKILECMLFGVPVVTTSEGVEGLPAQDGVHAGICEDDAGLIERAVALLQDQGKQERQRQAARALVEAHCSPAATVDAIEAIYHRILNDSPRGQ